jgi:hypothetical protein
MVAALKAFARKADAADLAIVYYAGHGIEIGGTNYLIPIDAKLETDRDVPLDRVLQSAGAVVAHQPEQRAGLVEAVACGVDQSMGAGMKRQIARLAALAGDFQVPPSPRRHSSSRQAIRCARVTLTIESEDCQKQV